MSAVFCGQALASTESATSGQSANSQCLSALPGRLGRGKFVLDGLGWKDKNQRTCHSYSTTAWFVSILSVAVLLCLLTRGWGKRGLQLESSAAYLIYLFFRFSRGKKNRFFVFSYEFEFLVDAGWTRLWFYSWGILCKSPSSIRRE